jgi:hypothetical protein
MALLRFSDQRLYDDYWHYAECISAFVERIRPASAEPLLYHCFWHGTLTKHHELSLKSLLVTQTAPFEVWLWAPSETIAANAAFLGAMDHPRFRVQQCDVRSLLQDTPLQGRQDMFRWHKLPAVSDIVRTVVVLKHGGVYFDLDVLFLRDVRDLTGVEFIYPWSNQPYANSAVMHFRKQSPNLTALARRAADIGTCHPRKLLQFDTIESIVDGVQVLPAFVFDPAWIAYDTRTPINDYSLAFADFFERERPVSLATFYPSSYAYHWHNGWHRELTERSLAGQLYRQVCDLYARQALNSAAGAPT